MITVGEAHEYKIYGQPTQVTNVRISSSSSSDYLDVPVGDGDQIRTIPFAKADRIAITFNQHVDLVAGDLTVWGNAGSGSPYALESGGAGFSYNSSTHVGTWTLDDAALPIFDQLRFKLTASGITDVAGNALDGEWDNPTDLADTSQSFPSGNGAVGGDFIFYVTLMPDVDGDNITGFSDLNTLLSQYGLSGTFAQGDFDGSGTVDFADLNTLLTYYGFDWSTWPTSGNNLMAGGGGTLNEDQIEQLAEIILNNWNSELFTAQWLDGVIAEIAGGS
jgi:hypothetical protein